MLREYFNSRADIWDDNIAEKDSDKLFGMCERLELKLGSIILDVGTGTGIFLPYLINSIEENGKIIALDLAEEMLAKARAKFPRENIEYLHANIMDIPICEEIFDSVVCYSSFPHFRDRHKALMEMRRVMKPGGRMFICHTSSRHHINGIHSTLPGMENDLLPAPDEMRILLSKSEFTVVKIEEDSESYLAVAEKPG
ncbi:MAG: class I SAM-dependent methyltransferase [Dehalococcoidales bacterium]|nr:MAG: class I SAM-dependent methyltransferase [Dehalococcoidales bacterium]